jgi:hypothetical protein
MLPAATDTVKAVIGSEDARKSKAIPLQTTQCPEELIRWLKTFVSS